MRNHKRNTPRCKIFASHIHSSPGRGGSTIISQSGGGVPPSSPSVCEPPFGPNGGIPMGTGWGNPPGLDRQTDICQNFTSPSYTDSDNASSADQIFKPIDCTSFVLVDRNLLFRLPYTTYNGNHSSLSSSAVHFASRHVSGGGRTSHL